MLIDTPRTLSDYYDTRGLRGVACGVVWRVEGVGKRPTEPEPTPKPRTTFVANGMQGVGG